MIFNKDIKTLAIFFFFGFVSFAVCCCIDDTCDGIEDVKRGTFEIVESFYDSDPPEGTISINSNDVVIEYVDAEGASWTVVYDIAAEH